MPFSVPWDESSPSGSQDISLGDDRIREFKSQVRERSDVDGYFPSTDDSNTGFHRKATLLGQSTDPEQVSNALILYSKTVGGARELHTRHESADIQQLTLNGKLWISALSTALQSRGDICYFDGAIWNRLVKGFASQLLRVNSVGTDLEWFSSPTVPNPGTALNLMTSDGANWISSPPIFTASFTSSSQTITSAGQLVLAHSLGALPKLVQARIVNQSTEANYAANDEVIINPSDNGGDAERGIGILVDATNITIRFGTAVKCLTAFDKTTGTFTALTNSKWKLVIRAWA